MQLFFWPLVVLLSTRNIAQPVSLLLPVTLVQRQSLPSSVPALLAAFHGYGRRSESDDPRSLLTGHQPR